MDNDNNKKELEVLYLFPCVTTEHDKEMANCVEYKLSIPLLKDEVITFPLKDTIRISDKKKKKRLYLVQDLSKHFIGSTHFYGRDYNYYIHSLTLAYEPFYRVLKSRGEVYFNKCYGWVQLYLVGIPKKLKVPKKLRKLPTKCDKEGKYMITVGYRLELPPLYN